MKNLKLGIFTALSLAIGLAGASPATADISESDGGDFGSVDADAGDPGQDTGHHSGDPGGEMSHSDPPDEQPWHTGSEENPPDGWPHHPEGPMEYDPPDDWPWVIPPEPTDLPPWGNGGSTPPFPFTHPYPPSYPSGPYQDPPNPPHGPWSQPAVNRLPALYPSGQVPPPAQHGSSTPTVNVLPRTRISDSSAPRSNPLPRDSKGRIRWKPVIDETTADPQSPTTPPHAPVEKPKSGLPPQSQNSHLTEPSTPPAEVPHHPEVPRLTEPPSNGLTNHDTVPNADIIDDQRRQEPMVERLRVIIPNYQQTDRLIEQLPSAIYTEQIKSDIRAYINRGNVAALRRLNRDNSQLFNRLIQIAIAVDELNNLATRAANGTLTRTDIERVLSVLQPFLGNNRQLVIQIQRTLTSLLTSSQSINRQRNTPRVMVSTQMPRRPMAPAIAIVPQRVPAYAMVPRTPLGVGMSSSMSGMAASLPPVAQSTSRMPVTASQPYASRPYPYPLAASGAARQSTSQSTARPQSPAVARDVLLINGNLDASINYNLNGSAQVMNPGYAQSLRGTDSWLVEFDRGGDFGMARYTLTTGTYEFTVTNRGWDLVRKKVSNESAPSPPESTDEQTAQLTSDDNRTRAGF